MISLMMNTLVMIALMMNALSSLSSLLPELHITFYLVAHEKHFIYEGVSWRIFLAIILGNEFYSYITSHIIISLYWGRGFYLLWIIIKFLPTKMRSSVTKTKKRYNYFIFLKLKTNCLHSIIKMPKKI